MYIDRLSTIVNVEMKRAQLKLFHSSRFVIQNQKLLSLFVVRAGELTQSYLNLNRVNRVQTPLLGGILIVFLVISHALKRLETNGTNSLCSSVNRCCRYKITLKS